MNPPTNRNFVRYFALISLVLLAWVLYTVFSTLHTLHTTGALEVTTSDKNAVISVSAVNKSAAIVGTGSTTVRLAAGTYLVSATINGRHATSVQTVKVGQTTGVSLSPSSASLVPSADNIAFTGLDALVGNGLSTTQAENVRQLFFEYKPSTKAVLIDPASITFAPHDPRGDSSAFTMNFGVRVDGSAYNASVTYSDLVNVVLTITDPSAGTQLFSGSSLQSSGDS